MGQTYGSYVGWFATVCVLFFSSPSFGGELSPIYVEEVSIPAVLTYDYGPPERGELVRYRVDLNKRTPSEILVTQAPISIASYFFPPAKLLELAVTARHGSSSVYFRQGNGLGTIPALDPWMRKDTVRYASNGVWREGKITALVAHLETRKDFVTDGKTVAQVEYWGLAGGQAIVSSEKFSERIDLNEIKPPENWNSVRTLSSWSFSIPVAESEQVDLMGVGRVNNRLTFVSETELALAREGNYAVPIREMRPDLEDLPFSSQQIPRTTIFPKGFGHTGTLEARWLINNTDVIGWSPPFAHSDKLSTIKKIRKDLGKNGLRIFGPVQKGYEAVKEACSEALLRFKSLASIGKVG